MLAGKLKVLYLSVLYLEDNGLVKINNIVLCNHPGTGDEDK